MSGLYEHYSIAMWIIDGVLWAIGLLCWIATYIGAPLESKILALHTCRYFLLKEHLKKGKSERESDEIKR